MTVPDKSYTVHVGDRNDEWPPAVAWTLTLSGAQRAARQALKFCSQTEPKAQVRCRGRLTAVYGVYGKTRRVRQVYP